METLPAFDIVIFGGSGDLARRKLVPALYHRHRARQLPEDGRIIGLARQQFSVEEYRALMRKNARRHVPHEEWSDSDWEVFEQRLFYLPLDATHSADYTKLAGMLSDDRSERVRVFYLATLPELFAEIAQQLGQADLVDPDVRLVLEKPLGHDLASAQRINEQIGAVFSENQIYRIDHYLGKETVQNLMALRFGNMFFEPLWRREYIRDVQITVAEQVGVEGRADFYDTTGALRDMVQNHLMQLLCIFAMEPPINLESDAIRDEKLKVVRALCPLEGSDAITKTVRGQYRAGAIAGEPVQGYLEEEGVVQDSRTETFVALRAQLSAWRWAGVPFYLRTGKRLQERVSEIVINFREVPTSLFDRAGLQQPNRFVIRLQPDEGLKLHLMAKSPGDAMRLRPVYLDLNFATTFRTRQLDAYERLLMDVVRGKLGLFMRRDELDEAWRWVEPILAAWGSQGDMPKPYTAGTMGPAASSALISRSGSSWYEETV